VSGAAFRIVPFEAAHDRTTFESASAPLDRYSRHQIAPDIRRRVTASFVALTHEGRIARYYTPASASIVLADLPAETSKNLPRYPSVPAVRMGRLAVDRSFQGQGLGGALLADALGRAARSEIAAFSLIVDAKDEPAAAFYRHHSFIALRDSPPTLFLPLATIPPS
jgi:ribosomal protein S18 acetylase RimI-like enzyme